ncbi:MAG: S-methyl-5-thioribose-1-phosphate isomerase [Candidatus Micrarchaeia archaeon]
MGDLRTVQEVARDIRSLKIQGARRIARAAVEALVSSAQLSRANTKDDLYQELLVASISLAATRPTEPMMRNSLEQTLRFSLAWIQTHPKKNVQELKDALMQDYGTFIEQMEDAVDKISQYGSAEIKNGANVLVHCHSSTTTQILIRAYDEGKNLHVTCLETRPLYQGRLTARELTARGLDVSLAVDSAAGSLMSKMDLVLTGADAITTEGDLINKIGTFTLAQLAHMHAVRFCSAAETYKFDLLTRFAKTETIEQRDPSEVWGSGLYAKEKLSSPGNFIPIPSGLHVQNSAFDRTPASFISAYISEEGIIPPAQFSIIADQKLKGEINGAIRI